MCSRVRIGIPILTVLLGAASLPSPVAGQDSAAVSATMLRALAEVAQSRASSEVGRRPLDRGIYFLTTNTFVSAESLPRKTTTL